jgi:hypothetical protein
VVAFGDEKRGKYNLVRSCKDDGFFTAPFGVEKTFYPSEWLVVVAGG